MSELTTQTPTGRYLHLQRLSTEDGPGIRTTVFLKGCLLNCEWCHNPESISAEPELQWLENNCIACRTCEDTCPNGCLQLLESGIQINRELCEQCGECAAACPGNALELLGTQISTDELFTELVKDRAYYQKSGGGVTLSGGEPAIQANFIKAVMSRLQAEGIHTALDTCGLVSEKHLRKLLPHTNMVMFDIKEIDPVKHQEFTGQSNELILKNLLLARDYIRDGSPDITLWIRTPLIPGATATRENIEGIGAFLSENLAGVIERWELCAFNNLCADKYQRLGKDWLYAETPVLTQEELIQFERWAKQAYQEPEKVIATGATQVPT
jgi:pyruvate formate lyase activating enzyme